MRSILTATMLAALAIAAPLPAMASAPAAAAKQAPVTLAGTFERDASASDNVSKAIDAAVAEMNFVMRPVAHSRLEKTNQPYETVAIALNGTNVSIQTDDRAAIITSAAGTAIKWKREDGELFNVSTTLKDKLNVDQTFAAEDGKRVNSFSLSPDGQVLTMHVKITSGKLPKPLTYKLVFKRTN